MAERRVYVSMEIVVEGDIIPEVRLGGHSPELACKMVSDMMREGTIRWVVITKIPEGPTPSPELYIPPS